MWQFLAKLALQSCRGFSHQVTYASCPVQITDRAIWIVAWSVFDSDLGRFGLRDLKSLAICDLEHLDHQCNPGAGVHLSVPLDSDKLCTPFKYLFQIGRPLFRCAIPRIFRQWKLALSWGRCTPQNCLKSKRVQVVGPRLPKIVWNYLKRAHLVTPSQCWALAWWSPKDTSKSSFWILPCTGLEIGALEGSRRWPSPDVSFPQDVSRGKWNPLIVWVSSHNYRGKGTRRWRLHSYKPTKVQGMSTLL